MKINKEQNLMNAIITYKIKLIDSMKFVTTSVTTSLSNFVDNLKGEIHKIKCKTCGCFLEYKSVEGNSIKYNCSSCNKYFLIKLDEILKIKIRNAIEFSKSNIGKFNLLLSKGIDP